MSDEWTATPEEWKAKGLASKSSRAAHFQFGSEVTTRERAVFVALGAASVCWENPGGAGIFDSSRCKEIGDALLAFLKEEENHGV